MSCSYRNEMMKTNLVAIRQFLKDVSSRNTFSTSGISRRQQRVREALQTLGWRSSQQALALHDDWESVDSVRRSGACIFEQYRLRLAVLTQVLPFLKRLEGEAHRVSFASPAWVRKRNDLHTIAPTALKRKLRDGVERLRKMGCKPVLLGTVELSAGVSLKGHFAWEPHLDFIVVGATQNQLSRAFPVRTQKSQRRCKWRKIDPVQTITGCVDYSFKFRPELRNAYIGSNGRQQRSKDHLRGDDFGRWNAWLASHSVTDFVVYSGVPHELIRQVDKGELATFVEEIV